MSGQTPEIRGLLPRKFIDLIESGEKVSAEDFGWWVLRRAHNDIPIYHADELVEAYEKLANGYSAEELYGLTRKMDTSIGSHLRRLESASAKSKKADMIYYSEEIGTLRRLQAITSYRLVEAKK